MNTENCIEIGFIQRPKGINGEMFVSFNYNIEMLKALFVKIESTLVPYHVTNFSCQEKKGSIKLQGIDTRTIAYTLKDLPIYATQEMFSKRESTEDNLESLIGYGVKDLEQGYLGVVQDIYTLPQQHLLAIEHQHKELLIPYHPDIVTAVDHIQKTIEVNLPLGYVEAMY